MQTEVTKKRFNVDEYYRMVDAGILTDNDRTELIDGEIIQMTAMGSRHAAVVRRINDLFVRVFNGKALPQSQLPLRLNDLNEPEPDIALLKLTPDYYASRHPGPLDTFLVIEVSDSSLHYDQEVKLPIYAAGGIQEVWILDAAKDNLLVYRNPQHAGYATSLILKRGDSVSCSAFADVRFDIEDLLGPLTSTRR